MSVFRVLSEILNSPYGIITLLYLKSNTCKSLLYRHIIRTVHLHTGCCRDYRQLHAKCQALLSMSYKNSMMDYKKQSTRKNENELMFTEYEIVNSM